MEEAALIDGGDELVVRRDDVIQIARVAQLLEELEPGRVQNLNRETSSNQPLRRTQYAPETIGALERS